MKIIPVNFLKKWENKCINVHPSLLPKYAGGMDLNVHKHVIDNKEKETGCTVHIITDEVDKGPIISQKKCIVNEIQINIVNIMASKHESRVRQKYLIFDKSYPELAEPNRDN